MTERVLASIRKIDALDPIPDADKIWKATVGGWEVVTAKDNGFKVGDLVVYIEIDAWVPYELAPFLSKGKEPRVYKGVKGERLKTIRLRGQRSQGLILPLSSYDYEIIAGLKTGEISREEVSDYKRITDFVEGEDVTEHLGVLKWEPEIPAQLAGKVRGNFPSFLRKSDQERCLSGDTLILTDNGSITIKEIVDNRLSVDVLSYNHNTSTLEMKPITDWSVMSRKKNWVKITLKSGVELVCTDNHKIWCEDIQAYREAKNLIVGQKLLKNQTKNLI